MTELPTGYMEDSSQQYQGAAWESEPIPVKSVTEASAPEYGSCMTWTIPQAGVGQPVQILQRQPQRYKGKLFITVLPATAIVVAQPAVPASGVAVQNTNAFPVTVVLSGFTATQVIVNGIVVGVSNGTYTVPAGGAISVTYSVVGTWVWSTTSTTTGSIIYNSKLDPVQGANPQGFTANALGKLPDWESQQPVYAIAIGGAAAISALDETYAVR